jgi:hypothetical protein
MSEITPRPQINVSKIVADGGIAGAIFAIGTMLIFLIGIPAIRYVFPAAVVLGVGVALALHFMRHKTPGAAWILRAPKK